MVDRLVAVNDADYRLPEPVRQALNTEQENRQGVVYPSGSDLGIITFSALQAACSSAASESKRVWAAGTLTTDQTLVVTSDADLGGLTIDYTGNGVALQLGVPAAVTWRLNVRLPRVKAINKTVAGWAQVGGTVGVLALNLNSCSEIVVPHIENFETGLSVRGEGRGNAYNTFLIGHLANNKINQSINSDTAGWSNQNTFIGGRFGHNSAEGVNTTGTRHISAPIAANPPNTNTWLGPSVEGNTAEFHVELAGTANMLINARWEAQPSKVRWLTGAVRNFVIGGYQLQNVEESGDPRSTILGNRIQLTDNSADPLVVIENNGSSAYGSLAVMEAGAKAAGTSPTTGYAAFVSAQKIGLKRQAEANDRLRFDAVNGRVYFANGVAAPSMYLSNFGTVGIAVNGGQLLFGADNTNDIGDAGARRPRYVRAATGLQTGAFTTGTRPSAATAGAGTVIFDTTLKKPIWSDGASWFDSTGAPA